MSQKDKGEVMHEQLLLFVHEVAMSQTQSIITRDGITLFRRRWPVAHARGTIVLVHGIAEHTGRYEHVAAQFNDWGWTVEGYDQRGHGQSDGQRGGLNQHDDLVRDLGSVVQVVRGEVTGPLMLVGHSLGGLVVGSYAAGFTEPSASPWLLPVDGVVLVSPALEAPVTLFQRGLMSTVGRLFPDMVVSTGFDPVAISRDPAVVEAYRQDPLVHDRISPRLARFIMGEGAAILARAQRWVTPTLVVYSGADRIVNPQGSANFLSLAPKDLVRGQVFPELAHEILNEPEKADVFAVLKPWLQEQLMAWQIAQVDNLAVA